MFHTFHLNINITLFFKPYFSLSIGVSYLYTKSVAINLIVLKIIGISIIIVYRLVYSKVKGIKIANTLPSKKPKLIIFYNINLNT